MRKEFVVMRIDAAPDGAPYVLVTLSLAKDMADALFTQDGLVIVLKEEDAPRAYEKLRAQISR